MLALSGGRRREYRWNVRGGDEKQRDGERFAISTDRGVQVGKAEKRASQSCLVRDNTH